MCPIISKVKPAGYHWVGAFFGTGLNCMAIVTTFLSFWAIKFLSFNFIAASSSIGKGLLFSSCFFLYSILFSFFLCHRIVQPFNFMAYSVAKGLFSSYPFYPISFLLFALSLSTLWLPFLPPAKVSYFPCVLLDFFFLLASSSLAFQLYALFCWPRSIYLEPFLSDFLFSLCTKLFSLSTLWPPFLPLAKVSYFPLAHPPTLPYVCKLLPRRAPAARGWLMLSSSQPEFPPQEVRNLQP